MCAYKARLSTLLSLWCGCEETLLEALVCAERDARDRPSSISPSAQERDFLLLLISWRKFRLAGRSYNLTSCSLSRMGRRGVCLHTRTLQRGVIKSDGPVTPNYVWQHQSDDFLYSCKLVAYRGFDMQVDYWLFLFYKNIRAWWLYFMILIDLEKGNRYCTNLSFAGRNVNLQKHLAGILCRSWWYNTDLRAFLHFIGAGTCKKVYIWHNHQIPCFRIYFICDGAFYLDRAIMSKWTSKTISCSLSIKIHRNWKLLNSTITQRDEKSFSWDNNRARFISASHGTLVFYGLFNLT